MPVKFSLVMPIYKTENFLSRAIESILDQDLTSWELICVCDGYSREATEIVRSYTDERIRLLTIDHGGACKARNEGAKLSTGKYLSFFSSDFQAIPGMLRTWEKNLEEHPDFDFAYGGYLFPDKNSYNSEEFDAYQLEAYNYIDGGFPLKRELWEKYPWDEKIKSLNDWDFWLRIVKAGHKGYFMRDYFSYIAEYPRSGGLSDDSHKNWIERTKQVKANNGIPIRDICVASFMTTHHAKIVARQLNADYNQMPSFKPHEYKMIYLIGFHPGSAGLHARVFVTQHSNCKRIIHWIGSDILGLTQMKFSDLKALRDELNKKMDAMFCESKAKQDELAEMGVKAEVLPLLRDVSSFSIKQLPKEFAVAVYMPGVNTANYNPLLMENVVKNMPDVQFYFYGDRNQQSKSVFKNVTLTGWTDIHDIIDKASVLLRFTNHDGLPTAPMEFIMSGRYVITNVDMPHVERIDGERDVEGVRKQIIEKIRSIRKGIKQGNTPDPMGAKYYKDYLDPEKIKHRLYQVLESH